MSKISKIFMGVAGVAGVVALGYGAMVKTGTGPIVAQKLMGAGDFVTETIDSAQDMTNRATDPTPPGCPTPAC